MSENPTTHPDADWLRGLASHFHDRPEVGHRLDRIAVEYERLRSEVVRLERELITERTRPRE